MYYYNVMVGDLQYHGADALTYASEVCLRSGAVVRIALRQRLVLGVVAGDAQKPSFKVKQIAAVAPSAPIPAENLSLIKWFETYYPAPLGAIVRQFLPATVAFPRTVITHKSSTINTTQNPKSIVSSDEQSKAIEALDTPGYHLLHGVTGSGKTHIYYELTRRNLERGKSAIILTPEIGLTSQLARSFSTIADIPVRVIHSRLKQSERRDIWYAIANHPGPQVIIGPRSAVFSPIANLGLIVVDESHDQSYKSDSSPNYRTDRVAAKLASLHGATMVSGSATPNVDEYYFASAKGLPIITLHTKAIGTNTDLDTHVIDMRNKNETSTSAVLSNTLIETVTQALSKRKQSLLFLNRRGTANVVLCTSCGWQEFCEHCDLPLTYHADSHTVRCHVCGRSHAVKTSCPECGNTEIIFRSIGTKAVVDEVKKLFPSANIYRFDSDTNIADQLENNLENLHSGKADIIIGTQMIAKGLDLPKLAVVGVINADSSLAVPDFTASERTIQLLNQVAGRVGRGHTHGTLCIQTYQPENTIVLIAAKQDWPAFYTQELAERRAYTFPPFCFMLKLQCSRASNAAAQNAATKLATQFSQDFGLHIEGPAPSFHPKENGKYKWQLVVKSTSRSKLIEAIRALPSGWSHDIDPIDLL